MDDVAHAGGDRGAANELGTRQPVLLTEEAGELTEEERVALCPLADRGDDGGVDVVADDLADELGRHVTIEPAQLQAPSPRLARDRGEGLDEVVVAAELHLAHGREDHHPGADEAAGEELDEPERRGVGPLEVVDDEQQRAASRRASG